MCDELVLSTLGKTWILDLDGTFVKHNGYKIDGTDTFLPGAKEFLQQLPQEDMILFVTSRKTQYQAITEAFLAKHQIRYHQIIFDAPYGERIVINDAKPGGLQTAVAINTNRDEFTGINIIIDQTR